MRKTVNRKWSGKSRGGKLGYLFFIYTIKLLGIKIAYCVLALVVFHFIPFAPKATRAIWQYNRRILHYGTLKSILKLYQHYFVFGQSLIDKIAIKTGLSGKYHFEFDNYQRFLEIIDNSKGAILVGAHVGCWEVGSVFFGKYGRKINIVMFNSEHSDIKKVIEDASEKYDFKVIPINEDALNAIINIKIALNNGEYICFNGDRYLHENSSMSVDFLGKQARFPIGLFKIANKCRVPVVFHYAMREGVNTYRFIFEEATINPQTTTEDLVNQYKTSLESIVRRYPQQWFNFYGFWD